MTYQIFTQPLGPEALPPLTPALMHEYPAHDYVTELYTRAHPHSSLPYGGGLWTSSYDPVGISAWARWWHTQPTVPPLRHWLCEVDPHAQVFEIDSVADLHALVARFPNATGSHVEWASVAAHYDGVHLSAHGHAACGHAQPYNLGDWPSESTFWFRWRFTRYAELGCQVPVSDPVSAPAFA